MAHPIRIGVSRHDRQKRRELARHVTWAQNESGACLAVVAGVQCTRKCPDANTISARSSRLAVRLSGHSNTQWYGVIRQRLRCSVCPVCSSSGEQRFHCGTEWRWPISSMCMELVQQRDSSSNKTPVLSDCRTIGRRTIFIGFGSDLASALHQPIAIAITIAIADAQIGCVPLFLFFILIHKIV